VPGRCVPVGADLCLLKFEPQNTNNKQNQLLYLDMRETGRYKRKERKKTKMHLCAHAQHLEERREKEKSRIGVRPAQLRPTNYTNDSNSSYRNFGIYVK